MTVCAAHVQGQRQRQKRPRLHRDRLRDEGEGERVGKSMKTVRPGRPGRTLRLEDMAALRLAMAPAQRQKRRGDPDCIGTGCATEG